MGERILVMDLDADALFAVDVDTGARTLIDESMGTGPVLSRPQGLVLDPGSPWSTADDRALVIDGQLDALIAVSMETGGRTVVSDAATGTGQSFRYPTT